MARREYQAGVVTTLATAFNIGNTASLTIASTTNWPTGASYSFWVTIDGGTAQEERVLCSSRIGTTVNIAASGRGKDGTTEANHAIGAAIWPSWSATDADEANSHINSVSGTTGIHGLSGALVGTTDAQTLSAKTLTNPTINAATVTGTVVLPATTSIGTVTDTELGYVDGVTSAIQTQLNTIVNVTIPASTPVGTMVMYAVNPADPPSGWLYCDGSEKAVATYGALDTILGTTYGIRTNGAGAAGTTHFRLPDLRGRAPIGVGTGRNVADSANLTARTLGKFSDAEDVTLTEAQMPSHGHFYQFGHTSTSPGNSGMYITQMSPSFGNQGNSTGTGGGTPHNNMQPSTVVNFIIKH